MPRKIVLLAFYCVFTLVSPSNAQFGPEVPYQDAVPAFIEELTQAVQNINGLDLDAIGQWEEDTRVALPIFLDELIVATMQFAEQEFEDTSVDQYQVIADQWLDTVYAYPQFNEVVPVIEPLVNQLFEDLPELRDPVGSIEPPFSNYFDLYQELEAQNPWGLASFFQVIPLLDLIASETISEQKRELTIDGVKSTTILSREANKVVNGEMVFSESIVNDEVVSYFRKKVDKTLLHEVLNQLISDGGDPEVITFYQEVVDVIDQELELAKANFDLIVCDEDPSLIFMCPNETPDIVTLNYEGNQALEEAGNTTNTIFNTWLTFIIFPTISLIGFKAVVALLATPFSIFKPF